ncbi:MAG TPA: exopolysaccharide biosynthesis polyprenyl glycosylphosphotransferase [Anaerolineaceae bacterium]|nr:exopolysaccharide biosynthesis polyprenyl glycosylphosphotransferase [Anaerolineaceae bacterium]
MAIEKPQLKRRWRIRNSERQAILFIGDLILSYLSVLIGLFFWSQKDWLNFSGEFLNQRAPIWFYLLPILWILFLVETYDIRKANRRDEVIRGIATAAGISLGIYLIVFFISEPNSLPRRGVLIFIIAATILTVAWRLIYIQIFTAPFFMRRALMIGAGKAGSTLAGMLKDVHTGPFMLAGYIDDDPSKQDQIINGYKVLGNGGQLTTLINDLDITDLIFAISGELNPDLFRAILHAAENDVEVTSLPALYEEVFGRIPIFLLPSDWILRTFIDQTHTSGVYESVKRLIDLLISIAGLLVSLLLFPLISLLIILDSGLPILYSQMRVGKYGRPYRIYKFRTMYQDAEKDGVARTATHNDARITRVGKILRRSHLDEIPQFWNILIGENSMIGPRAEQIELVNKFQEQLPFYRARLFVQPGLTGWAQINQRYATTLEETAIKLEYDLYYIKNRNLLLDMTIVLRTVGRVLGLKGL